MAARLALLPEALLGCTGQSHRPAGLVGHWVLGEVSFIVTGPESTPSFPPSGHCEGDCASGILFDVVGEQLEDGDFPENTVGVSLWGRSGVRGEREGLRPGWRSATALATALGGSSLLDSRPPKPP